MFTIVYQILWQTLGLIFTCYKTILWVCYRLQTVLQMLYGLFDSERYAESAESERIFLERCKSDLTKLPKHLNIIVGPEERNVDESVISRIFSYALIMNIDFISIFDTRLSTDNQHVRVEQLRVPNGMQFQQLHEHHYQWIEIASNGKPSIVDNGNINGTITNGINRANGALRNGRDHSIYKSAKKSLEIYEIQIDHGRPLIAKVCRDLFCHRHDPDIAALLSNRLKLTQRLNDELQRHLNDFPNPELSLILNSYTCTFGMLPWQTRFTEFLTLDSKRCLNAKTFVKALYTYSRCEQRWGK